ncbi:unnamed protein product, partial [Ectocarpus sp. 12 AP-2014]
GYHDDLGSTTESHIQKVARGPSKPQGKTSAFGTTPTQGKGGSRVGANSGSSCASSRRNSSVGGNSGRCRADSDRSNKAGTQNEAWEEQEQEE